MLLMENRDRVREEAARLDLARLQGRWSSIAGHRTAEVIFEGNQYTLRFLNGDSYSGTFTLDATHRPRAMDLAITEGPERNLGKTALAIYQVDEEHFIWAPSEPGSDTRMCAFPHEGDRAHLCIVFQRVA